MTTLAQARLGLNATLPGERVKRPRLEAAYHRRRCAKVIGFVAQQYGLPVPLIVAGGNQAEYVKPRHIAMLLCHDDLGMSLPAVGKAFGGRHHTTVLHGVRKVRGSAEAERMRAEWEKAVAPTTPSVEGGKERE